MDVGLVNEIIDEEDEINDSDDENQGTSEPAINFSTSTQRKEFSKGQCLTCRESEPEMCILPCIDFCICESCWNILKSNEGSESVRCPLCKCTATGAKKMNFI